MLCWQICRVILRSNWSSTADRDAYAKQLAATDQFPDIPFAVTVSDFAEAGLLVPFDDAYLEENFLMPQAAYVDGRVGRRQ